MKINKHNTALLLLLALLSGCEDETAKTETTPTGRWVTGDMHIHSTASDGHNLITSVLDIGYNKYGMDYLISTDHGGFKSFEISSDNMWRMARQGSFIVDWNNQQEPHNHDYAKDNFEHAKHEREYAFNSNIMLEHLNNYRQQELASDKLLLKGMEWTAPYVDEHTTLFIDEGYHTSTELNSFHNQYFKGNPSDQSEGGADKQNMLDGVAYLQQNHPTNSFFTLNHPSRKHEYRIEIIREMLATGPNVFAGMEGAPGHQRNPAARGSYEMTLPIMMTDIQGKEYKAYHGTTYGGFDYMTAKVGGVWDALLSEGHRFSIFVGSDFHSMLKDFWPGEYSKTHLYLTEESPQGIINAIKSGKSFATHGDLITQLDFHVTQDGRKAEMGEVQAIDHTQPATVNIQFTMPETNNNGDAVNVEFVDVIIGTITNQVLLPGDEMYNQPYTDLAKVIQSFESGTESWSREGNTVSLSFTVPAQENPYYLRLRGSNTPKGTDKYVDAQGNPISDLHKDQSDIATMAWKDLWFYSNPVYVNHPTQH
ncbi:hypothetical protein [Vibrio sp. St2]|uniref:hypothetical protein n=1 Tax=Vibrio sp. St2 TaxID=2853441 RepID=UPI00248DEAA9|nr:hypothetical protein [Vibrio sp. St2]